MNFSTRAVKGWNSGWAGMGRWLFALGCLALGCVALTVGCGSSCELGGGLYARGGAGECGAYGGRCDAADHGDVDGGEWV